MDDQETRKIRQKNLKKGWAEVDRVLHFQGLLYLPEIIRIEKISKYYDNPLARYFGTKKTRKLLARKYDSPTLQADINAYVKGYDVCLASKAVRHKLYRDLQSFLVSTHR